MLDEGVHKMNKRRSFTREFKLRIIQELATKSTAELCREHNLSPSLILYWKQDYEQNPTSAFAGHGNLWKDEAKLAEKDRLIGQLYAENAFLKKALERLQLLKIEEQMRHSSK